MAASHSDFGVRHVTVVPTNFQPADSDDEADRTVATSATDTTR